MSFALIMKNHIASNPISHARKNLERVRSIKFMRYMWMAVGADNYDIYYHCEGDDVMYWLIHWKRKLLKRNIQKNILETSVRCISYFFHLSTTSAKKTIIAKCLNSFFFSMMITLICVDLLSSIAWGIIESDMNNFLKYFI